MRRVETAKSDATCLRRDFVRQVAAKLGEVGYGE